MNGAFYDIRKELKGLGLKSLAAIGGILQHAAKYLL